MFLKNVRLLLKYINEPLLLKEKTCAADIFLCVAASKNILMFLKNVRMLPKRY